MDIARPEFRQQKRRRPVIVGTIAAVVVLAATIGVSRLKPAAPTVERSTVWTDTVKRGPMLRRVRGLGLLVPTQEAVRLIPAETEATVMRILVLPRTQVKADTIVLKMSNSQVEQAATDGRLQLKAAEASQGEIPKSGLAAGRRCKTGAPCDGILAQPRFSAQPNTHSRVVRVSMSFPPCFANTNLL